MRDLDRIPEFPADLANLAQGDTNITEHDVALQALSSGDEPLSEKELLQRKDLEEWLKAEEIEWKAIVANGTIRWIRRDQVPKGTKIIKSKWVWKRKPDRYKARCVAKGFMQSPFDYGETYAPVAKFSTIRSILAHAAIHDLPIRNLDIGNAYLNSFLPSDERCFMEAPPRYGRDGYVCMLIKSLYGLKSAGRLWNETIDKWFKDMGYKQSTYDPCLYYYKNGDRFIYVALYVDDCIYVGDDEYMKDFERAISAEFKVRLLGDAKTFLGMEINKNSQKGTVEITQKKYIKNIANKFGLSNAKAVHSPLPPKIDKHLEQATSEQDCDNELYRSIIGSLMYAQNLCRPDISFAVSKLSRYLNAPKTTHLKLAKRVVAYLNTTCNYGIKYSKNRINKNKFSGYADADFASDTSDRKSVSGWIFMYGNGAVSWRSLKQTCVALSTPEAEYLSVSDAGKEARSLRKLQSEFLNIDINDKNNSIKIWEDNRGAELWCRNPAQPSKSKQIDICYHHIRDEVRKGSIVIGKIPTQHQLADALTKALHRERHHELMLKFSGYASPKI